jgi:hypothetical protein
MKYIPAFCRFLFCKKIKSSEEKSMGKTHLNKKMFDGQIKM